MVVVGSRFTGARLIFFTMMRALGAILRDIGGASPHQHGEAGK
jgi:hypothetical protein